MDVNLKRIRFAPLPSVLPGKFDRSAFELILTEHGDTAPIGNKVNISMTKSAKLHAEL